MVLIFSFNLKLVCVNFQFNLITSVLILSFIYQWRIIQISNGQISYFVTGQPGKMPDKLVYCTSNDFQNRPIPHEQTFISAVQHLRDHGRFQPVAVDRNRTRSQRTLNAEPQILDAVEENPGTSIRRLSA